jgi:electron transfer flavoprotein beta subunit
MKILVCVKQIPENLKNMQINSLGTGIQMFQNEKYRLNRFDAHAVEAAVVIKEQMPNTSIDIVTVGPSFSDAIVRRAMGMGVDNGLIIQVEPESYLSPSTISALLAKIAAQGEYDLILTGIMSEDEMNGQTGQMVAARLNIPAISGVVHIEISDQTIGVIREREGAIREHLVVNRLDIKGIVLTIQAGINQPRYPGLSALLTANSKELMIIDGKKLLSDICQNDQSIIEIHKAAKIRQGKFIEGSIDEKVKQFLDIMKEKDVII